MALPLLRRNKNLPPTAEMGFVDHLEALRWHILRSVIAIMIFAIASFIKIDWIFDHIIFGPMRSDFFTYTQLCTLSQRMHMGDALCMPAPDVKMQVTAFGSQFMSSITISILLGFIIAFPYICWELWRFIKPALSTREVKNARGSIFWVTFFFITGVSFGYFLLAPFTFSFLSNYHIGTQHVLETRPTLDDYMENMVNIIVGTGLAFELPVISYVLSRIGLITPVFLRTYRKYAYLAILVIAAIITPSPDWMSQAIVAFPLFILFEISILISARVQKEMLQRDKEFFSS
ncbi:MAG: twin-arginine translocase subunit TatC [Chitinophagaceae bacterium]|nr:twin-arginine translocase subunit TatC [Chitinophagaceae bacterium]